ncbi:FtsW/RodA/SpoVE family cell cycle protein [Nonomuraea aridisoli]|uniref:FtsW/RodA/SpoVE family cell cycle protein n=1 Tax=Nonomuraea aridisoli TaxID=2070368 RepID=UPI001F235A6C|nr:FtsW/RodA/SpoVE family cell cycle protein [Nonomuraea aridisoli]
MPEQHTDFVFTVAGEELGFAGAALLPALLWAVLWRALRIAAAGLTPYARLVAAGIVCWLGAQTFVNVGMVIGLMPIVGVPLPFVSYGGSSIVSCLAAVGVLMSLHRRTALCPRGVRTCNRRPVVGEGFEGRARGEDGLTKTYK